MDLVAAIDAVMRDASWSSHAVMEKLAQPRNRDGRGARADWTTLHAAQERHPGLICKGFSDAEIAATLKLSRNIVRNHTVTLASECNHQDAADAEARRHASAAFWIASACVS
jgi:DNA-binding NarL/FixJ family response regulator